MLEKDLLTGQQLWMSASSRYWRSSTIKLMWKMETGRRVEEGKGVWEKERYRKVGKWKKKQRMHFMHHLECL